MVGQIPGSGPQRVVTYDKEKLEELRKRAEQAKTNLQHARPAYRRAATFLDRWVQQNFRSQGGKVGGWKPLKAGGRYINGALDVTAKILQDTGILRASFHVFATNKNAGIGSDIPYAEAHEEGKGVPQRRMLPKRVEVAADLKDILSDYVRTSAVDEIAKAFRGGPGGGANA